ncbi:MAG: PKD-like domain-containing protein, partial [bacterium]
VVCSGYPFEVSPVVGFGGRDIVPGDTRYSWGMPTYTATFTGGDSGTSQTHVFGNITNKTNTPQTATYIVTPTTVLGNCQGAAFTVVVTVNPTPEIGVLSTVVCSGYPFEVSPAATFGGRDIVTTDTKYSWGMPTYTTTFTGGDSGTSQTHVFGRIRNTLNTQQTATYIVTPRADLGGCQGTPFTLTVTVNPTAEITAMSKISCNGLLFEVSPTNLTNGIVPDGTLYSWDAPTFTTSISGGASDSNKLLISGTLFNESNVTQRAYYNVRPASGNCSGAAFSLEVILNPTPVITTMTTVTCSGVQFVVTPPNSTNGIVPEGTTYTWLAPQVTATMTGGESKSGQNSVYGNLLNRTNTVQTATYSVIPNISNCGDGAAFTVIVTVNPTPEIGVLSTVTCSGVPFQVSPAATFGGRDIVTADTKYRWDVPG